MKKILFVMLSFPLFASAANIQCSGLKMIQGQMTKPSLILLVEKSSNLNIQKVKIYETDEKQQKNVLFASGVLMGRLQSLEKNRVNLTLKDQSKVSGFMTRGNGAWKGAISLELNGSSSGALFRGCGEL